MTGLDDLIDKLDSRADKCHGHVFTTWSVYGGRWLRCLECGHVEALDA